MYWLEAAQPSLTNAALHQHGLNWPKQPSPVYHLLALHGTFLWTKEREREIEGVMDDIVLWSILSMERGSINISDMYHNTKTSDHSGLVRKIL